MKVTCHDCKEMVERDDCACVEYPPQYAAVHAIRFNVCPNCVVNHHTRILFWYNNHVTFDKYGRVVSRMKGK
jgi:hypothetical protein